MSARVFVPSRFRPRSRSGADGVAARSGAGGARRDLEIAIVRTGSRGLFWLEPLVEVETPEGRVGYGPVAAEDAASLFDAGFLNGGAPSQGARPDRRHPLSRKTAAPVFARCGVIDPLSLDDYRRHGGLAGLARALCHRSRGDRRGGAGLRPARAAAAPAFRPGSNGAPSPASPADQKYVVCNADEGDSGTFADRMLMEGRPFPAHRRHGDRRRRGRRDNGLCLYPLGISARLRHFFPRDRARPRRRASWAARVLGSPHAFDIEARLGAGAYICGEETSLLDSLEGKRGQVRAKPPLPAISGLFGKPTVINNVLSFASVPWILDHGAKAYADYGVGRSRGTQPFQLAGNVRYGGLIELAFGATIRELVEDFGGGTRSGRPIRAVQVGGPLGAYFPAKLLDTPLDYEAMLAAGGMLGHGGIVVFDDTVDMARQARFAFHFCAKESCGKCTPCRIGSTRGAETIDKIVAGIDRQKNVELLRDLCEVMTDGSLCALGGLTPMPVLSALDHFGEDFAKPPARAAAE